MVYALKNKYINVYIDIYICICHDFNVFKWLQGYFAIIKAIYKRGSVFSRFLKDIWLVKLS